MTKPAFKIADDFGYRIKIPLEQLNAMNLVDNGANPYKKIKNKSLQHLIENEYKRRVIINIMNLIIKSTKKKRRMLGYMKSKRALNAKRPTNEDIRYFLEGMSWKKVDVIYKFLLQHERTKKMFPKHSTNYKIKHNKTKKTKKSKKAKKAKKSRK